MKESRHLIARTFHGMVEAGIVPGKRYPIEEKFCVESYYAIINERGNVLQIPVDSVGVAGTTSAMGKKYYLETTYNLHMGVKVEPCKVMTGSVFIGDSFLKSGFMNGGFVSDSSAFTDTRHKEHKAATEILDKYLPVYRRSDKGFKLPESVEWIAKLNKAHHADCMKYEAIIETLMDVFDINTVDGLKLFAENLKKSADIIDAIRKK